MTDGPDEKVPRVPRRTSLLAKVSSPLAAVLVVGAIYAGAAGAYTNVTYCYQTVAPMSKCSESSAKHSYTYNVANGVQDRANAFENKCEKLTWFDNEADVWSRKCAAALSVTGRWDDTSAGCCSDNPGGYYLKGYVGNNISDGYMYLRGVSQY